MVPPNGVCAASGGIDVDELAIFGGVGEGVDAILGHLDPVGRADRLADGGADVVEAGDGHRQRV